MGMIAQPRVAGERGCPVIINSADVADMQPAKQRMATPPGVAPAPLCAFGRTIKPPEQEQIASAHALIVKVTEGGPGLPQSPAPAR